MHLKGCDDNSDLAHTHRLKHKKLKIKQKLILFVFNCILENKKL